MNKILFRLAVGLLTFSLGIVSVNLWSFNIRHYSAETYISPRSIDEENIAEAVFLYQISQIQWPTLFFLVKQYRDPSDEFMQRFEARGIRVKKIMYSSLDRNRKTIDKETGEYGTYLGVDWIKWINDSEVEVGSIITSFDEEEVGGIYHVIREGDRWIVKSRRCLSRGRGCFGQK